MDEAWKIATRCASDARSIASFLPCREAGECGRQEIVFLPFIFSDCPGPISKHPLRVLLVSDPLPAAAPVSQLIHGRHGLALIRKPRRLATLTERTALYSCIPAS